YGRLPSLYASQGFDTANLLISAAKKSSVKDSDAFREALRAADFDSVRGNFEFSSNQHPVQDIYVREVIKEGDVFTNKLVSKVLSGHSNVYEGDCKL
ncbi:MAG: ABC transporter substrate-binding protein, partial [Pseudomonadota bacterium]